MSEDERVTDLDLMAYADGLFVADCERRRRVERRLAECPEEAERVGDYRAQNAAIRAAFDELAAERVPERIERLFAEPGHAPWIAPLRRAAAAVVIAATAAAAGWYASDSTDERATHSMERLAALASRQVAETPLTVAAAASDAAMLPHEASVPRIAFELAAPDLSERQLTLKKVDRLRSDAGAVMRLIYNDPDGRAVSILIRPRQDGEPQGIRVQKDDSVTVAFWQSGPLAVAIAADWEGGDVGGLAETVQAALVESLETGSLESHMAGDPSVVPQPQSGADILDSEIPGTSHILQIN